MSDVLTGEELDKVASKGRKLSMSSSAPWSTIAAELKSGEELLWRVDFRGKSSGTLISGERTFTETRATGERIFESMLPKCVSLYAVPV